MTAWLIERGTRWTIVIALVAGVAWSALRPPPRVVAPPYLAASTELPPWFGDASKPDATIAGRVWHDGAPLAALVYLRMQAPDPRIWYGRMLPTTLDGRFDFGPQRPGRYWLLVIAPGLASRVAWIDTARDDASALDLFAYACRPIRGQVRADGVAVEGASIELAGVAIAATDRRGAFDVCIAPEEIRFEVRAAGFRAETAYEWDWREGIELHRAYPIRGRVVDERGAPVAGAMVQPIDEQSRDDSSSLGLVGESPIAASATTDRDGRFAVEASLGLYAFDVRAAGRAFFAQRIRLAAQPGIVIAMGQERYAPSWRQDDDPTAVIIRGQVRLHGRPVPDAEIGAYGGYAEHADLGWTRSRLDGSFELHLWASSTDEVVADRNDLVERGRAVVEVHDGDVIEGVTIELVAPWSRSMATALAVVLRSR